MKALVEGGFKEAIEQSVEWDDVNELTFVSFWHFVYSGDYDTPEQLVSPASKVSTSPMKADAFEAQFGKCTQIEQFQPEILDPDDERLVEPFGVDT